MLKPIKRTGLFLRTTRRIIRSRVIDNRPFFVSHLITTRCFARCPTCLWRGDSPEERETAKIIDFYSQAREEGFIGTAFWGGEPLLREDSFEILKACRRLGLVTGLVTNGYLIPKYHRELSFNLDFLIVSIDIPSKKHDELRGVDGLFERAIQGISLIREENPGLKVFINSLISKLNYTWVEEMVKFCEEMDLTVTFESVTRGEPEFPRSDGSKWVDLRLPREKEREAFRRIRGLKKGGKCINNSLSHLRMFEEGVVRYNCNGKRIFIRVEPNGDVTNCLDRKNPLGNVYEERLSSIIRSERMRSLQRRARNCSRCVDTGTIESSLFWEFHPEVILNTLRLFLR